MTKLFSKEEGVNISLSLEEFLDYHKVSKVVSTEAASDYFFKIKDTIANTNNRLFSNDLEKATIDATGNKYEVINVSKRIMVAHLSDEVITVPEKFKGLYLDYVRQLSASSECVFGDTIQLLSTLKMSVASFINEYKEGGVSSIYGVAYVKASKKKQGEELAKVSKFFPSSKSTSKAMASSVIKTMGDVENIYKEVPKLSASMSSDKVEQVQKLAKEVSDMVDVLIEQNKESGILSSNTASKQELVDMIYIGAKGIELCGYLYSNSIFFYSALQSFSQAVLKVGGR